MNLNSDQIKAFLKVCRTKNISTAAQELALTQAALSIRIQKLEDALSTTLFVRHKSGITLTETGQRLLTFAQAMEDLEMECLGDLTENEKTMKGALRVGCFSTIGRSLVLPAMSHLLQTHPQIELQYHIREIKDLASMLVSSEVDFVFMDSEIKREGIINEFLGNERYVHITSKKIKSTECIFLNHDEDDMMTYRYFEHLGKSKVEIKRRYLDEIYSVIDGVALGLGESVLPDHLIQDDARIQVKNPTKSLLSPVYLCYKEKPYQTRLFKECLSILRGTRTKLKSR